jgi:hypothetical protein
MNAGIFGFTDASIGGNHKFGMCQKKRDLYGFKSV